jgi:hypothetical protein
MNTKTRVGIFIVMPIILALHTMAQPNAGIIKVKTQFGDAAGYTWFTCEPQFGGSGGHLTVYIAASFYHPGERGLAVYNCSFYSSYNVWSVQSTSKGISQAVYQAASTPTEVQVEYQWSEHAGMSFYDCWQVEQDLGDFPIYVYIPWSKLYIYACQFSNSYRLPPFYYRTGDMVRLMGQPEQEPYPYF